MRIRRLLGRIPGSADVTYKSGQSLDLVVLVDDLEAGIAAVTQVCAQQEIELQRLRLIEWDVNAMRRVLGTG